MKKWYESKMIWFNAGLMILSIVRAIVIGELDLQGIMLFSIGAIETFLRAITHDGIEF